MDTRKDYTQEDVETAVYEFIAASVLDAIPEDKLEALDEVLTGSDEEFDAFLVEHIPHLDTLLRNVCEDLALPKDVCAHISS